MSERREQDHMPDSPEGDSTPSQFNSANEAADFLAEVKRSADARRAEELRRRASGEPTPPTPATPPPTREAGPVIPPDTDRGRGDEGEEDERSRRRRRGREAPPEPEYDPRREKLVLIEIPERSVYPIWVKVPLSQTGKIDFIQYLRNNLTAWEQASLEDSQLAQDLLGKVKAVIIYLREGYGKELRAQLPDADQNLVELAQRMDVEYSARVKFGELYKQFFTGEEFKVASSAVKGLTDQQLSVLFKMEGFTDAIDILELNAGRYLYGTNDDGSSRSPATKAEGEELEEQRDRLREDIAIDMARAKGFIRPDMSREEQVDVGKQFAWAVNLGERYWQFTGRMVRQDTTVSSDVKSGGNWYFRRVLAFKGWVESQQAKLGVHPELIKNLDLEQQDYFEFLATVMHTNGWFKEGKTIADYLDVEWMVRVKDANGVEVVKEFANATEEERINGTLEKRNPDEVGALKLSAVDWSKVNFKVLGAKPMQDWGFLRMEKPEEVRNKLTENRNAHLFNPTEKTLASFLGAFDYQSDKGWKAKMALIKDFARFVTSDKYVERTGRFRYTREMIDAIINRLTGYVEEDAATFIRIQDRVQVMQDLGLNPAVTGNEQARSVGDAVRFFGIGFLTGLLLEFLNQLKKIFSKG